MMRNVGILLAGIGVLLLGLAAMIYVIRGPQMTSQERMVEKVLSGSYSRALTKMRERAGVPAQSAPEATEAK